MLLLLFTNVLMVLDVGHVTGTVTVTGRFTGTVTQP